MIHSINEDDDSASIGNGNFWKATGVPLDENKEKTLKARFCSLRFDWS